MIKVKIRRKADDKSPDIAILSFGATELHMPKKYYSKPQVLGWWTEVLESTKKIYSPKTEKAGVDDYATRVRDFEIKVSKMTPDPEQAQDVEVSIDS